MLHSTNADAVDTKSNEGAVLLKNIENIRDLDLVYVSLLVNHHALLCKYVVKKAQNESDNGE